MSEKAAGPVAQTTARESQTPSGPAAKTVAGPDTSLGALGNQSAQALCKAAPGQPQDTPAAIRAQLSGGSPLPEPIASNMSRAFSRDLRDVRVHEASPLPASIGARAFATGRDIAFSPGELDARTKGGQELIAHELAHVVQQERVAGSGGRGTRALEGEADAAARSAVAGEPVRALSAGGRADGLALHRDEPEWAPGIRPSPSGLSTTEYVDKYADSIVSAINVRMSRVNLGTHSPYARWAGGSPSGFFDRTWLVYGSGGEVMSQLRKLLAPSSPESFIDKGRDLQVDIDDAGDPIQRNTSVDKWFPAVAVELGNALTAQVDKSIARIVPRYVAARQQLKLKQTDDTAPVPEPAAEDLTASHPLDRLVIAALCSGGAVEIDYEKLAVNKPVVDDLLTPGKPRAVQLEFQASKGAWFWVRAVQPADARPEEVAAALYGSTDLAYRLIDAAPLFGFTGVSLLTDANKETIKALAEDPNTPQSVEYKNIKGSIGDGFEPARADPVAELLAGPLADEAALNQASKVVVSQAPVDRYTVLDRMRISGEILDAMMVNAKRFHGSSRLTAALTRLTEKRTELTDADDVEVLKWNAQSAQQERILSGASSGVAMAAAQLDRFLELSAASDAHKLDESVSVPLNELADAYVQAAAYSHLVGTGASLLAAANARSRTFSIEVMEGTLRALRHQIEIASEDKKSTYWGFDTSKPQTNEQEFGISDLRLREEALQEKLSKAREDMLRDPDAGAASLQTISDELADFQTEVMIVANMDAIDSAVKALFDTHSKVADFVFHESDLLAGYLDRARGWRSQWASVYALWKSGKHDDAKAQLKTFVGSPAFRQFFTDTARYCKDVQAWNVAARIIALIAITVATMGIGAYVGGFAAAAWGGAAATGAEVTGGAAMAAFIGSTVAEATAFTTLNALIIEENPTWKGVLWDFGWNLATFGALKKFSSLYRSAELIKGATEAGKVTVVVGGEMGGQFGIATISGLAKAEIEKRAKTGKDLSSDEVEQILIQSAAMFIGLTVAGRVGEPFLKDLSSLGTVHGVKYRLIMAQRARLATLAQTVKTNGFLPAARELMKADAAEMKLEIELYNDLLNDPDAMAKANYTPDQIESLQKLGSQHLVDLDIALAMANTTARAEGVFTVPKEQLPDILAAYKKSGVEPELLSAVEGNETWLITPKDGAAFRVTVAEAPRLEGANFRHGPLRPSADFPGNLEMDLLTTVEGETVVWGRAYIGVDADGNPNLSEPPELNLENRVTVGGRTVRVTPPREGGNLTKRALEMLIEAHVDAFGAMPENMGGSLAESNLANFQKEYAQRISDGMDPDVAEVEAVKATSFGKTRLDPDIGYSDMIVETAGFTEIDFGPPIGKQSVPTAVKVKAFRPLTPVGTP